LQATNLGLCRNYYIRSSCQHSRIRNHQRIIPELFLRKGTVRREALPPAKGCCCLPTFLRFPLLSVSSSSRESKNIQSFLETIILHLQSATSGGLNSRETGSSPKYVSCSKLSLFARYYSVGSLHLE
jgi:hypothetical protein